MENKKFYIEWLTSGSVAKAYMDKMGRIRYRIIFHPDPRFIGSCGHLNPAYFAALYGTVFDFYVPQEAEDVVD